MRALVTGGGGFLGSVIVRQLRERGDDVVCYARGDYPALRELGVQTTRGDVTDAAAVHAAAEGCDVVFHIAAKIGSWGRREEFVAVNVDGTRNVIDACRAHGISRLVFTSSPSVAYGPEDHENLDETAPYLDSYLALYPETKAIAERLVRAANDHQLATVCLRPHLIWGPDDTQLIPRLLDRARQGRLRRIGSPTATIHTTYVDNGAQAHVLAADRLAVGSPIAGKVYFIAQDPPVRTWEFVDRILACAGLPPLEKSVSAGAAYRVGALLEGIWKLFGLAGEPPMTRFVASQLSTTHWFDLSAARRDLGFEPSVSIDEGLERLARTLAQTSPRDP